MVKVLVVDDDETIAHSVGRALRSHYEVTVETDPNDAVARIGGEHFDVIVCDERMPGLHGTDVLRVVRSQPEPAVFILASGNDDPLGPGIAADGVLMKPFSGCELRTMIAALLET